MRVGYRTLPEEEAGRGRGPSCPPQLRLHAESVRAEARREIRRAGGGAAGGTPHGAHGPSVGREEPLRQWAHRRASSAWMWRKALSSSRSSSTGAPGPSTSTAQVAQARPGHVGQPLRLHRATNIPVTEPRLMHRTTIAGSGARLLIGKPPDYVFVSVGPSFLLALPGPPHRGLRLHWVVSPATVPHRSRIRGPMPVPFTRSRSSLQCKSCLL